MYKWKFFIISSGTNKGHGVSFNFYHSFRVLIHSLAGMCWTIQVWNKFIVWNLSGTARRSFDHTRDTQMRKRKMSYSYQDNVASSSSHYFNFPIHLFAIRNIWDILSALVCVCVCAGVFTLLCYYQSELQTEKSRKFVHARRPYKYK